MRLGSALPAVSVALTVKVWAPTLSARGGWKLWSQVIVGPPSRLHSKVAVSSAWKAKVGRRSVVSPTGPLSMVVCGATVSTLKSKAGGASSTLPAGSVALTTTLWAPSASGGAVNGPQAESPRRPPSICS